MRPAIATIAPRVCGIRAKSTTMPSRTSRSEYRSMTESRKAPNGVTWPEPRAGALERLWILDLPPLAVLHVKGVERLVDLGRDPRAHDVEPEPGERLRDEVEEPEPVRTLHLDHRGGVRELVVEGDLRRAARARRLAPGGAAPGEQRGHGLLAGEHRAERVERARPVGG